MAAGLTVQKSRLGDLRGFMETRLSEIVAKENQNQTLKVDGAITARSATIDLVDQMDRAGPYGQGNPQPMLVFPAHTIRYAKIVGADHVSFSAIAGDGSQIRAIAFRAADSELGRNLLDANGKQLHLAGNLNADIWQGVRRVQLRVADAALPG